ncbi:MAG: glycosyltransferase [Candidatus Azobacteroides sp.]|nr:glycosyltransferase [Candidatus Azobacteroides sp.]
MNDKELIHKISIITVCFNSEQYIHTALESVRGQTYHNIEYIIVDGNSSDNTLNVIKRYEPVFNGRMQWISESDKSLYDAMNKGIRIATGDIIGILNSDDVYCDPHTIEKVMNVFNKDNTLDAVYADLYYVSQIDTSHIVRKWITGKQKPFKSGWHPGHTALFLKKKVYDDYGLYNLDFKLVADFELMLRVLDKYKIKAYYLPEYLVKMRLGGVTNKSLKNIWKQNIECIKAFSYNGLSVNKFLYPFYRILPKLLQFK